MCEETLCIHKSIYNTVIQVMCMGFKMLFKSQLSAPVNPFM